VSLFSVKVNESVILNKENQLPSMATHAQVFNQKHLNERIMFKYQLSVRMLDGGKCEAERIWYGLDADFLAKERIVWCPENGLQEATMLQPHLNESGTLLVNGQQGQSDLSSQRTQFNLNSKSLTFAKCPCTMLSIPFEVMHHWQQLIAGETLHLDYAVLKVQAHTGVSLTMFTEGKYKVVSVTPEKWFWRLLFGSTKYYFEGDAPKLVKIIGLLEPRDRNSRGKYVEYLGRAIFDNTLDFSTIKGCEYA